MSQKTTLSTLQLSSEQALRLGLEQAWLRTGFDPDKVHRVHLTAIGGVGMASLAAMLKE